VQGALLRRLLALACAALLAGASPPGMAASAQVSIEVPQGKAKTVRLRKLPRGTVLAVSVSASGRLLVALVSAVQLKSPRPEALFRGALERRMSFKVVIPESSDYFLVLDNRRGTGPVQATATMRAERGSAAPPASPAPKKGGKLNEARAADLLSAYSPRPENASTSPR
jgi:hypothetical protein